MVSTLLRRCLLLNVLAMILCVGAPCALWASEVLVLGPPVNYSTGGQNAIFTGNGGRTWMVAEDVNGDGKPDIVVANWCASVKVCTTSSVSVLLNRGNGTFQPVVTYPTGAPHAFSVSVADVNGDGKRDLIVAMGCANLLTTCEGSAGVLLGNGDGTFQSVRSYSTGGSTTAMAVADLNHDGHPDVIVSNCAVSGATCGVGEGAVGVLLGNPDGSLQPVALHDSGALDATYVTVADVNRDHKPDLLVVNAKLCDNCLGNVGVLLGRGDGTFQTVATHEVGLYGPGFLQVADLNADGKMDLIVTEDTGGGGAGAVLYNLGYGRFQAPITFGTGGLYATPIVAVDLNGDGQLDLVSSNGQFCGPERTNDGCIGVLLNTGSKSFLPAVDYDSAGVGGESLASADFDGDGHFDVVVTNQCGKFGCGKTHGIATTTVLLGKGDGTVRQSLTYGTDFASDSVLVADLNGDGRPDVVVGNAPQGSFGTVSVLLNSGVANDTTGPNITTTATGKIVPAAHGDVLRISVAGTIADDLAGVNPGTLTYVVADSGGNVRRKGTVYMGVGGRYSQTIGIAPTAKNPTLTGTFTITIRATDNAANIGSKATNFTVVE